jgi:hypothetical protein
MPPTATREIGSDKLQDRGDDLYAELLAAHAGLSEADSRRLNARLVLLLLNELGDVDHTVRVLREARRSFTPHDGAEGEGRK